MIRLRAAAVASVALALVIAGVLACGDVTGGWEFSASPS